MLRRVWLCKTRHQAFQAASKAMQYVSKLRVLRGAEFVYPESWLADQTLFFRRAQRLEQQRGLDPPALPRPASSLSFRLLWPLASTVDTELPSCPQLTFPPGLLATKTLPVYLTLAARLALRRAPVW